jgi:hypothetical protein
VAEAALQDGVGAIVEGGEGRHVADTFFSMKLFIISFIRKLLSWVFIRKLLSWVLFV